MDHPGGYPSTWFVVKPSAHFTCGVCLEVLNNPHQCRNGHSFCLFCISSALEVNRECPSCKTALKQDNLVSNLVLRNMIGELEVKCNHNDETDSSPGNRCEWTGTLDECLKHFECCEHRMVTCPLCVVHACCIEDCTGYIKRKNTTSHITSATNIELAHTICTMSRKLEMQQKEIELYQNICFNKSSKLSKLENGCVSFGACGDDGHISGKAIVRDPNDNTTYVGNYIEGQLDGFGVTSTTSLMYYGEHKNGMPHGLGFGEYYGKRNMKKNLFYRGSYKDARPSGFGTVDAYQCTYTGEQIGLKYHGEGTITYADGRVYKGKFENDEKSGPGTMTYPDGAVFTGTLTENNLLSEGKLVTKNGIVFEGKFNSCSGLDESDINGKGTITYTDGSVYTGQFWCCSRYGKGTLVTATGDSVSGKWKFDEIASDEEEDEEEE